MQALLHVNQSLEQAKEKAAESEERYRIFYQNAPLPYQSLDAEGCFIDVNPMWLRTLGYERDEVIGKWFGDFLHPDLIEHFNVNFPAFKKQGSVSDVQFKLRKKDGTYIHVSYDGCIGYTPEGGFKQTYCVFKDITAQKRTEEKLRESEERFKALHNASFGGIGIHDKGIILECNQGLSEMTGYSPEELIGMDGLLLISPDSRELVKSKILAGYEKPYEAHGLRKNGEVFPMRLEARNIPYKGKMVRTVEFRDITESKQAEKALIAAKEKAEESDLLKSAFLANMSHEIRTPMNGILGFAELLKEPDLSVEKHQKYIRIIEKSGLRMLNIINNLVDISKIEAGLMKPEMSASNINEQIEYIYAFFKPEADAKGIKLSFNAPLPANEATIRTDPEKLVAILTNLVKNAIKFTDDGEIEFGYYKKDEPFEFYVKDTGAGIPKNRQEAIFERFLQADIADKMALQGAGLGLAISKAFVEMLGGNIRVESETGKGSTFYFTLPCPEKTPPLVRPVKEY
ncbi:MAG: PAS domain-containing sensor histidine kinase [Bacteroidales bacterium]